MPVFVLALGYKVLDTLLFVVFKTITELTTTGAQTTPELLLVGRHSWPWLVVRHGQLVESLPGACFRFAPGRQNDLLKGLRDSRGSVAIFS